MTRVPILLAVGLGELAGALLAVGAALTLGPAESVRLAASVLLGEHALDDALDLGAAITMALLAHPVLAGLFGWLYGALHGSMVPAARVRSDLQALAGVLFGIGLWFVDVQLVARLAYPWFVDDVSQLGLAALHALFFGLPLGLFFAAAARGRAARLAGREPAVAGAVEVARR